MSAGDRGVVIVGAGQSGLQVALALREKGYEGSVTLIGDETAPPYQRPPLSKGLLSGAVAAEELYLEEPAFFDKSRITWLPGRRAVAIDRVAREVVLAGGRHVAYGHLVLAAGSRNRALPGLDASLPGVFSLRTIEDAERLKSRLGGARRVVVIGAGFLGLEAASIAVALGADVQVIEAASHLMGRVLSIEASRVLRRRHELQGVRFLLDSRILGVLAGDNDTSRIELEDGTWLSADLVLVAVGVQPNVELAGPCGLPVGDGIVVDEWLRTADPAISAVGDCASFPFHLDGGRPLRLESVQNAVDQGDYVAGRILGDPAPYARLPVFWSEQAGVRVQIAGVAGTGDGSVVRAAAEGNGLSVFRYRQDRLVCVESIDRPADHMLARRLLAARLSPMPSLVSDPAFDLKQFISTAASVA